MMVYSFVEILEYMLPYMVVVAEVVVMVMLSMILHIYFVCNIQVYTLIVYSYALISARINVQSVHCITHCMA